MTPYLPWLSLVLGILCRFIVPFLLKRREDPFAPWDSRYLYGQLLTVVIAFLVLPFAIPDLFSVAEMSPPAAYVAGWFAADVGREADKFLSKS